MEEWLWWVKFYLSAAAFLGSFFGGLFWILKWALKKLDKRTESIVTAVYQGLSVELLRYFNAQLTERDERLSLITSRLDGHELHLAEFRQTLSWQNSKINQIGIAGTALATISMYPSSPSKRDKDRMISDWKRIFEQAEIEPKGD